MTSDSLIGQVEKNDSKKKDDEETRPQYVLHAYKNRLKFVKEAHIYAARNDFSNAIGSYQSYLEALALFYNTPQDKLVPSIFKRGAEDVPEQMLLSLVYWEMGKIFDRNPKMAPRLIFAMEQFIKFSLGHKYQYLNAESLRKYLSKGACIHKKVFEDTYKRLQVNSKKCFIATYTLGDNHPDLFTFYKFRDIILNYKLGEYWVETYYKYSPRFVFFIETHPLLNTIILRTINPSLRLLAKLIRKFI